MVEVSLTVGKLDASLALLLTKDHHLIEFPTILLPDGVQAGSIVKIRCDRDIELESKELQLFNNVQEEILKSFGQAEPESPVLKLRNVTQTSCVLEWEPLKLSTATIKSLSLLKNGQRLGQIPNPLINTTTKLSGLPIDTPYKFSLKLDTTAGIYYSNEVDVRTHKMTDLSGITVCLGEIDWKEQGIDKSDIERILKSINAKPLQSDVQVDTTHFVCTLAKGPQWKKAVDNNIPVVRPEWLKACDSEKRIVGVRMFYLDANNDLIRQHKISHYSGGDAVAAAAANTTKQKGEPSPPKTNASENFDDVPLNESTPEVAVTKSGQTDRQVEETAEKLEKLAVNEKEEEKQAEGEAPVVAEEQLQLEARQNENKSSQGEDAKKEESVKEEAAQETNKDAQVEQSKQKAQPQFDSVSETPAKSFQVETPKEQPQPQFDGVPETPANNSQVEPPKEQPQPEFDGVAETPQLTTTEEAISDAPKETQSEAKTAKPIKEPEEQPKQEETITKAEEVEENGKKDFGSEANKKTKSHAAKEAKDAESQESEQKADDISKPEDPESTTKTEESEIEETEAEETETKEKVVQPTTSKNKNKKKNKKNKKK